VQGKTDDAARTGRPGKEDNAAMRVDTAIPFGLPARSVRAGNASGIRSVKEGLINAR